MAEMLLFVGLSLAAGGCWDTRQIETLAVATSMAVDRPPDGQGILVTGDFSIPQGSGSAATTGGGVGGGGSSTVMPFARMTFGPRGPTAWIVGGTGPTLNEAQQRLDEVSPRQPFWAHVRVIIVGEELAKSGLQQVLESVVRDRELRQTAWLVVARGVPGYRILELPGPFGGSSEHLSGLEENLDSGPPTTVPQRLYQFLAAYEEPGLDPVASGIVPAEPVPPNPDLVPLATGQWPAVARVEGTAVFRDDRLTGWLAADETRALELLRGASRPFKVSVACPTGGGGEATRSGGGRVAVQVTRWTTQRKAQWPDVASRAMLPASSPSGATHALPRFSVVVQAIGAIEEIECDIASGTRGIPAIEREVANLLESDARRLLRKLHGGLRADPVGFGLQVFRARPGLWDTLEPQWRTLLAQLPVEVRVQFEIRHAGLATERVRP